MVIGVVVFATFGGHDMVSRKSINEARVVYAGDGNITEHFRATRGESHNTQEAIELAYDLQAGEYVAKYSKEMAATLTSQMADILNPLMSEGGALLDVGCGELTTLSPLSKRLGSTVSKLYAFDLSWSRIKTGVRFAENGNMRADYLEKLSVFCADMGAIPLPTGSIDVVTTTHALEPNGGRELELLREILRVTKSYAVLFEPSFDHATDEGKARMVRHGYVKGIDTIARSLGATIISVTPFAVSANPLNPTAAYVIKPNSGPTHRPGFTEPGTNDPLIEFDGFFFSSRSGLSYPTIRGVPILRSGAAILTSALSTEICEARS